MRQLIRLIVLHLVFGLVVAAAGPPPPLFMAVIADTQKPDDDPLTDVRWAVEQVNAVRPDAVLVPGDLTNTGTENQYRNIMSVLATVDAPLIAVPGNHEGPPGETIYADRFEAMTGQPSYRRVSVGGWELFALDSVLFHGGKLAHEGGISQTQLDWIRSELATLAPDAPIMVMLHHPLRYPVCQVANEDALLATFSDRRLLYSVSGHKHLNRIYRDGSAVWHIVTGSLSFSCDRKHCGIGYRLISTIGRDLWTAWIETGDPEPLRALSALEPRPGADGHWRAALPQDQSALCVRLRYRGRVRVQASTATALSTREAVDAFGTLQAAPDWRAIEMVLPSVSRPATVLLPFPDRFMAKLNEEGGTIDLTAEDTDSHIENGAILATTTTWKHLRLKQPGENAARIQLDVASDIPERPAGHWPVVAVIDSLEPGLSPTLQIDGEPVVADAGSFVMVVFDANGLQSQSHGFRNHLYVNGDFRAAIAADRNVNAWETFTFVVPRHVWERPPGPSCFTLTAGTPEDGSGANPPANNEDYQVRRVGLFDGNACVGNEPAESTVIIGDNHPARDTALTCTPTHPFTVARRALMLHDWQPVPGRHRIAVGVGQTRKVMTVDVTETGLRVIQP